ncbi:putative LPS assembly protein LptD [Telluribacter sp. SYSU D00476]|uniref:putative LPS assembly protein LptD n=1 Tax=Telluribacter sp. SYSU D00476 TaxID=2811430 RepID=UPI001FF2F4A4|nr:putative LPS assembly protein LptD [Telluribacter sp. SYSU D00476]
MASFYKNNLFTQLKKQAIIIWLGLLMVMLMGQANAQQRKPRLPGLSRQPQTTRPVIRPADGTGIPRATAPGTAVPGTAVPGTAVPGTAVPGTAVPGTAVPGVSVPRTDTIPADTSGTPSGIAVTTDSTQTDTLAQQSDLQAVVEYAAEDSTIMDVDGKQVHLYGNAQVTYGSIKLQASYIRLNWVTNEVFAKGTYDSTAKKVVGDPVFQDGPETFNAQEMRYNFKSKKGISRGVVTQQGEGNIRGNRVKRDDEGNLFIHGSIYTTCTLTHPHFHINAPKLKVIENKQVVSGPFNLVIADVPLPIGLPFGFFPFPKKKEIGTSGILFPQYGEEPNGRGFYLRDGGYYFAISKYVNAAITGQIYSTGSWGAGVASTYAKRYRYNGNFAFRFNRNRSGDEIDRIMRVPGRNDFSLLWSHAPVPRGTSTFSANVNITSNSFNQFNAIETQRYISNIATSSVQYNRNFGQYARAGASVRVNQNFGQYNQRTGLREGGKTAVSSDFNFGINQIAPFALNGGIGRWYESFRLGMEFTGNYTLSNALAPIDTSSARLGFTIANPIDTSRIRSTEVVIPFEFANLPTMLRDAQFAGRYSLPISLPNFKLMRYINFTPSISLQGEVFTKKYNYTYLGNNQVRIDTVNTIATQYTYGFGAGMNTRFYGTFFVRGRRLEAIRHTVIPSLSFSYTPDFSTNNSFYQQVTINDMGETRMLSRFRGLNGGVGSGSSRAAGVVSYSINNSFEMKLRSRSDTAATQFEKVSLLDNLSIGGSYNMLADSLNLSNVNVNANARIGQNLNLNFNMNFDPYAYVPDTRTGSTFINSPGIKINEFAITRGQGLARLQNLNLAVGTSFSPKKGNNRTQPTPTGVNNINTPPNSPTATEEQLEFIERNPDLYVDFNIPWNVTLNYNFGLSRIGLQDPSLIQTVNVTGDLSLTPKWKLSVQSGFDFVAFKPSITTLTLYRDLHCWDMSFNWTPFAGSQFRVSNYNFTLKAKSSILQDLKLTRRRSFYDRGGY